MEKKRLAKFMAAAGVASRRACEEFIFSGRVRVNGVVTLLPQTLVDENDQIMLDSHSLKGAEGKVYYILNKPAGYLCSPVDSRRQKLVLDLFDKVNKRLFTVGRLDKDTTGLLIVTNDGAFAHQVMHPLSNIRKEYIVKVSQEVSSDHLKAINEGTEVDGGFVKPISVTKVRRGTVKIVVAEGRKREVRLLVEAAGLEVKELKRVKIGGLRLGTLPVGTWREMTEREKTVIFH
ncbi:MAG TPA: pseudouridine synthase [Waddliaceae bacterium]